MKCLEYFWTTLNNTELDDVVEDTNGLKLLECLRSLSISVLSFGAAILLLLLVVVALAISLFCMVHKAKMLNRKLIACAGKNTKEYKKLNEKTEKEPCDTPLDYLEAVSKGNAETVANGNYHLVKAEGASDNKDVYDTVAVTPPRAPSPCRPGYEDVKLKNEKKKKRTEGKLVESAEDDANYDLVVKENFKGKPPAKLPKNESSGAANGAALDNYDVLMHHEPPIESKPTPLLENYYSKIKTTHTYSPETPGESKAQGKRKQGPAAEINRTCSNEQITTPKPKPNVRHAGKRQKAHRSIDFDHLSQSEIKEVFYCNTPTSPVDSKQGKRRYGGQEEDSLYINVHH